jgi:hypothetical protein
MTLAVLDGTFAIHRPPPAVEIPPEILRQGSCGLRGGADLG